jgi:hypothetical protein
MQKLVMSEFPNKETQFKKGNSGGGKPKGTKNRSTLLKKWLEVGAKVGTVEDEVILALIKKAKSGDIQAIKEIQDTLHGKIADKSEVKHEGDIIINLNKGAKL